MAPKYQLYSSFTVKDALAAAGAPEYNSEFQEGEPPIEFFTQAPKDATAIFSTLHGARSFRLVENPTPERNGHYWWAAEIQLVCDELRRNLPDECKKIETPQSYWDLYMYFDAYDIYHRGAQNLWNVINTLVFENKYAQQVVEDEQKTQTEQYMPLFEHFASELLKRPQMQTKLLSWNKRKQADVLKVLTPYHLRIFEGYEKYPEHFLNAIRGIFARRYDDLRNGFRPFLPLYFPFEKTEELDNLRRYLQFVEAADDPFMDKFAIPNRIINGIVIADGTSKTAALKAKYESAIASSNFARQKAGYENGARDLPPRKYVPVGDFDSSSKESSHTVHWSSSGERYSSAPNIGGDPTHICNDAVTEEARVYPGDGHEVNKKLMGCQKPSYTNDIGDEAPRTQHSHWQQVMSNTSQHTQYQGNPYPSSPDRQETSPPASKFVQGPVPSGQEWGTREGGISQGLFAYQIPPYAMHQKQVDGPPPAMQQTPYPYPGHIHPSGDSSIIHGAAASFYAQLQQQQHTTPPTSSDSLEWLRQQGRNPSAPNYSKGKWQKVGSDDIHGPKVIFRKGSVHDTEDQNHRVDQWQGKESNYFGRWTSTVSNKGNFHRPSNPPSQQDAIYNGPRQTGRNFTTTGRTLWTPAALGHSSSNRRCVNAGRQIGIYTQFDPCPCENCSKRDRTIFVGKLKEGLNQTESGRERLKQHFSKFGRVDAVTPVPYNFTRAHVMFANPKSAIAAVYKEADVKVADLGESSLVVNFRTGSQFFKPHLARTDNRARQAYDAREVMRQPPASRPNVSVHVNSWRDSPPPTQQAVSLGGAPFGGRPSYADVVATSKHAEGPSSQAAIQSEGGVNMGNSSCSGITSPVIATHHIHGLEVVNANDTHDLTSHQPPNRSISTQTARPGHSTHETTIAPRNPKDILAWVPGNGDPVEPDEEASIDHGTVRIRPGKARYVAVPPDWRQESTPPPKEDATVSEYHEIASKCGLAPVMRAHDQPIPPLTESNPEMGTMEQAPENTKPPPQHEASGNNPMAEDSYASESHSHIKRKASETGEDENVPDQPSPKKQFSKAMQPPQSMPGPQSTQPEHQQQRQQVGEGSQAKIGKRNKRRQNLVMQPAITEASSTTVPFESQNFTPAIPTSHLPPYPHNHFQGMAAPQNPEPVYVRMPQTPPRFTNRPGDCEPFPPYRDLMSGPQPPVMGHGHPVGGLGPNRSISSNPTMMHYHDGVSRDYPSNPGAQNFNPGPVSTDNGDPFVTNPTMYSPRVGNYAFRSPYRSSYHSPHRPVWGVPGMWAQEPPQLHMSMSMERLNTNISAPGPSTPEISTPSRRSHEKKVEEYRVETENVTSANNKDEPVPQDTGKENTEGKPNAGAKQGGGKGKGKFKNAKAGRDDQKSANLVPAGHKAGPERGEGSRDAAPKKAVVAGPTIRILKRECHPSPATKQHPTTEPQIGEFLKQGGAKDVKTGKLDKGKGKEVLLSEKKPAAKGVETTTTAETNTKNDNNDGNTTSHSELRVDANTAKKPDTKIPSTPYAPISSASYPKPKQGKAKNWTPKKGAGTKQPPIARPSAGTTTNTGTNKSEAGASKTQEGQSKTESVAETKNPAPSSSSSSAATATAKPKKSFPALAPIPLYGALRSVLGMRKGAQKQDVKDKDTKDAKDATGAEKAPPDGERKGG